MMKRILCLISAMLACFAGCGTEDAVNSASDTPEPAAVQEPAEEPAEQPETTAEPAEPAVSSSEEPASVEEPAQVEPAYTLPLCEETETLTYWITMPPPATMVIEDMSQVLAYEIAEERTNVHMDFLSVSEMIASENFNLLVAANNYPDLLLNVDEFYGGGAVKAYNDEVILELGELIETYGDNYKKLLAEDPALKRDVTTDDGGYLSMWCINNVAVGARGPLIRQDWLDALGMHLPVTYEDYHEVLLAFKNEIGCTSPLNMASTGYDTSGYLTAGYGISLANPFYVEDGTVKFAYLEEGFRAYVTMMNQWYQDGIFNSDYLNNPGRYAAAEEPVVLGTSGLTYISTNQIDSLFEATEPGFALSALTDAVAAEGDLLHFGDLPDSRAEEPGVSISASCEKPALAVCWLDYFYGEEGALLANFGEEGNTYELKDGVPTYTDVITNSETGFDSSLVQYAYLFNQGSYYKDATRLFCIFSDMVIDCYDVWQSNLSEDRWEMPSAVSLTVAENDELTQLYSDIETLCTEMLNKFIIGERPLEELDAFVDDLKTMDAERCVEIYQGAYDRYLDR